MPFVKLDCGLLKSTLWFDRDALHLFITALLSAVPVVYDEPVKTFPLDSTEPTDFVVPPGWYGLVESSSLGLIHDALMKHEDGMSALRRLGEPDAESRTPDFGGRRLVRVEGGFLVLNFEKFREKDYTAAERQRRWRERKNVTGVTRDSNGVTRHITQAEAEAEAEEKKKKSERPGASRPSRSPFVPPSLEEVRNFAEGERLGPFNAGAFVDFYASKGWRVGATPMRDWKAAAKNAARKGWTVEKAAPDPPSPTEKARREEERAANLQRLRERDERRNAEERERAARETTT